MLKVEPFNWQHRLHALHPVIGGWSVEVWNPMAKAWDRNPNAPHWPAEYEAAACEWVDLTNANLRDCNAAASAQTGA